jgi:nucleotide-binding universal stress UspA family protein
MYSKIVVTLDGSAYAECALSHAEVLAKGLGVELVLLQVVPYPEVRDEAIEADWQSSIRTYMNDLAVGLKAQGIKVRIEVLWGDVAEKIVEYVEADEQALLVMSTHGRTGLAKLAFGSVSERVLKDAKTTPVLICR